MIDIDSAFSRDFAGTDNAVGTIITLGVPKTKLLWSHHLGDFVGLSLFMVSDLAHNLQKTVHTRQIHNPFMLARFLNEHFQNALIGRCHIYRYFAGDMMTPLLYCCFRPGTEVGGGHESSPSVFCYLGISH